MNKGEVVRRHAIRSLFYFGGMTLLSLGIVLTIYADLGVNSWDVLHLGISYNTPLSVGVASVVVGIAIIAITVVLSKRWPPLGCFINMVYCGVCVDFFIWTGWFSVPEHWLLKALLLTLGVLVQGLGTGIYISANYGSGPRDGLTITLSNLLRWSVRKVRVILELIAVFIGWLLGGPVFVGTILAAVAFGPVMQSALAIGKKLLTRALEGRASNENIDQGTLRVDNHDGVGQQLR